MRPCHICKSSVYAEVICGFLNSHLRNHHHFNRLMRSVEQGFGQDTVDGLSLSIVSGAFARKTGIAGGDLKC